MVYQYSQAFRVISKFGGVTALQTALLQVGLELSRSAIFKWFNEGRSRGNCGRIPAAMWEDILNAAQLEGVFLTSEDMDPRPIVPKDFKRVAEDLIDDPYYGGHQDEEFQDNPELVALNIPSQRFDHKHRGRNDPRSKRSQYKK